MNKLKIMLNLKFCFVLILSVLFSFALVSQNQVSIKGGIFSSKNYYDSNETSNSIEGIDLGTAYRFYVYKKSFIQTELSFIQKGGLLEHPIEDIRIVTNQLEVSGLIGYELEFKKLFAFINIGVFTGKILNEKTEGNPYVNFDFVEVTDSDFDWGYAYGGGIGIRLGKGKLFAEYRYKVSKKFFRSIKRGNSP